MPLLLHKPLHGFGDMPLSIQFSKNFQDAIISGISLSLSRFLVSLIYLEAHG